MPPITLLTDFGLDDTYVGVMKGVILTVNPAARIVDLTHAVPPQDVATAARRLAQAWPHFPPGSIHVVVVDPGVGSRRAAVIVRHAGHLCVAPDNGVLSTAAARSARLTPDRARW